MAEAGGFERYHLFAIRGLRSNRTLRELKLEGRMAQSTSAELVEVLENQNTTLIEIQGLHDGYESQEDKAQIDLLLQLNRYGQRLVRSADFVTNARCVPMELWGDVLSRIGTGECNRFVLELAQRAVRGQPADASPPSPRLRRRGTKRSRTSN
jgi:hypothetical protein